MVRFPDLPNLSNAFGVLGQFINVLIRKVRAGLVSGAGTSACKLSGSLPYGYWATQLGTDYTVTTGTPFSPALGVRVNPHFVKVGEHVTIKSVGECDCVINPNDDPEPGECIWLDPAVPGHFTNAPQGYPAVGIIISNGEFPTKGWCHCVINLPLCLGKWIDHG